jgi:hypothetical protein
MTFTMESDVNHRSTLMDQAKRLKFGAIFFTVFWIGGMLWWSGEHHPAYIILLAVCGSIGGYLWFLAMNWMFQHLPPLNGNQGSGRKAP